MNKAELIEAVATKTGTSKKDAADAVAAVLDTIQGAVARGEDVVLPAFGTFKRAHRAAREARNPGTGQIVKTTPKNVPTFKAGAGFRTAVNA